MDPKQYQNVEELTQDLFGVRTSDVMGREPIGTNPAAGTHKGRPAVTPSVNPSRGRGMGGGRIEYRMDFRPSPVLVQAEKTILPEEWATMTPELLQQLFKERAGLNLTGNPRIIQNRINEINMNSKISSDMDKANHAVKDEIDDATDIVKRELDNEADIVFQEPYSHDVQEEGEPGTYRSSSAHQELLNEFK